MKEGNVFIFEWHFTANFVLQYCQGRHFVKNIGHAIFFGSKCKLAKCSLPFSSPKYWPCYSTISTRVNDATVHNKWGKKS